MTDLTGKSWMAIGETDDPNALIVSFEAAAKVTKGDPVYLSADHKVSPAAAAQDCIGIAVKSAASGEQCPVLVNGESRLKRAEPLTADKAVYGADASKRVLAVNGSSGERGWPALLTRSTITANSEPPWKPLLPRTICCSSKSKAKHMKPKLFESLMQRDGEFKEHVENLGIKQACTRS